MGSAIAHCCGGVARSAEGRRHDDRRGRQEPRRARPVLPAMLDDVATLEAQAARLRSSIVRRRNVAGCSNKNDNVSDIISHYEEILEGIEQKLLELGWGQKGRAAPLASPTLSRKDSVSTTCSSGGSWRS